MFPSDGMRKVSILGADFYVIRGLLDRRHQCKDISEPENVKDTGYVKGLNTPIPQRKGQGNYGVEIFSELRRRRRKNIPDSGGTVHRSLLP